MSAIVPSPARARPFRINVEEAVRFVARDREWPGKLGLGAVFSLLSIVLVGYILVEGYLLTFTERVARAEPLPLPEWDEWGELLRKGAIVFLVDLVYSLPLALAGALVVAGSLGLPLAAVLSTSGAGGASGGVSGALAAVAVALTVLGYGGLLIFAVAMGVIRPAAHAQLVLHDADLAAAFRPDEVVGFIRRHPGQYAVAVLLDYGARSALLWVGYLARCVGIFAMDFLCKLFLAHMIGQLCWHERVTRPPATSGAAG
jgi:hypothetical protein